jgi:hypothetical protein
VFSTQQRELFAGSPAVTDRYRRARLSRGSELAEGFGELAAEPPVFLGEVPVAFTGGLQPVQQGCVGGSLSGGNG